MWRDCNQRAVDGSTVLALITRLKKLGQNVKENAVALQWRREMSTGLAWQDEQHKQIFQRIDELLEAMSTNQGPTVVKDLLDFLEQYSRDHFKSEEDYMHSHACTTCGLHEKCHQDFIEQLTQLKALYERQGASTIVVMKLEVWLKDWLIKHIMNVDKLMAKTCTPEEVQAPVSGEESAN